MEEKTDSIKMEPSCPTSLKKSVKSLSLKKKKPAAVFTEKDRNKPDNKTGKNQSKTSTSRHRPVKASLAFKGILSSDSDSDFENIPPIPTKCKTQTKSSNVKAQPKLTIKLCSDSEDDIDKGIKGRIDTNVEKVHCLEDSMAACGKISESPDFTIPNKLCSNSGRYSTCSDTGYNYTVIKNRDSIACMTIDLDQLGEPLVESTRIHRRSSASFKQIFDKLDEEDAIENGDKTVSSSEQESKSIENGVEALDKALKGLELLNDVADKEKADFEKLDVLLEEDEKFVTAVEILNETSSSSNSDKGKNGKKKKSDTSKTKGIKKSVLVLSDTESDDEYYVVEVIDTATQTEEVVDDEIVNTENVTDEIEIKLKGKPEIYRHDTIINGVNEGQKDVLVYEHETEIIGEISEDSVKEKESEVSNELGDKIIDQADNEGDHGENTELNVFRKESSDKLYEGDTEILELGDDNKDYKNKTEDIDEDKVDNVYDHATIAIDEQVDVKYRQSTLIETHLHDDASQCDMSENSKDSLGNVETNNDVECLKELVTCNDSSSGESEFEVVDIGIQTETSEHDMGDISANGIVEKVDDVSDCVTEETVDHEDNRNRGRVNKRIDLSGEDSDENVDDADSEVKRNVKSVNRNDAIDDIMTAEVDEHDDNEVRESSNKAEKNDKSVSNETTDDISDDAISKAETDQEISFAAIAIKSLEKMNGKKPEGSIEDDDQSELNNTHNWRSRQKYSSSGSSDEGDLEAFFQKLRKPEKKQKENSPRQDKSMSEFIVEDDEMSSESGEDNEAFYLGENNKLDDLSPNVRLPTEPSDESSDDDDDDDDDSYSNSDSSDDDFSSKVCPSSVTQLKKKTYKTRNRTQAGPPVFSFSTSESDDSSDNHRPRIPAKSPHRLLLAESHTDSKMKVVTSQPEDPLFKTPNPIRKLKGRNGSNKENSGLDGLADNPKRSTSISKTPKRTPIGKKGVTGYISLSDSDNDGNNSDGCGLDDVITLAPKRSWSSTSESSIDSSGSRTRGLPQTPENRIKPRTPLSVKVTQPKVLCTPGFMKFSTPQVKRLHTYSFLKSLCNTAENDLRDLEAKRYVNGFKRLKVELSTHLFKLYNDTVFEGKLPSDMPVTWNNRLLRTAGFCAYKKNRANPEERTARIELSTKVCDSAERVRDTLIHEMCHAAVWLLNGTNGGHGPYWKYWARHASRVHPELPAISRCHSYSINTKFTYKCQQCGYSIGRHSKSLNTDKFVCGYCKGKFELITNPVPMTPGSAVGVTSSTPKTPRTPNRFAMFMKENYSTVKQTNKDLKHGEVMKELSKMFAASKI